MRHFFSLPAVSISLSALWQCKNAKACVNSSYHYGMKHHPTLRFTLRRAIGCKPSMHVASLCAVLVVFGCASETQPLPLSTAWQNVDLSETNIKKATKQLQDALIGAAKDMNIANCGDLSNSKLRQTLLSSLQAIQSLNPSLASAALLAKTRVLGSIQDLRREGGSSQLALTQLFAAQSTAQLNPQETQRLARITTEAKGALGLINYAEQITDQLQRLGG